MGKTTCLKDCADNNRKYVTFDNPSALLKAKEDTNAFLKEFAPPVFIDEIQYAPEIFRYIKILVDDSDERGRIWMTGSQQFNMMQGVTESLAGRVAILNLLGFSIYEREDKGDKQQPFLPSEKAPSVLSHKTPSETFHTIWQGSFPDVIDMGAQDREIFYESYIQTYIERDVRQLITIGDESSFMKFLKVTAARSGQELDINDIARNVDISSNTAKKWLSILQTSGLIYLLQPYFRNITKRLTKTPKLYFMDTGLACHLAGWTTSKSLENGISAGAFFETFVISEIIKSYYHNGRSATLYYFRDSERNEIDLLIHQDGQFYPIEIKKTSTPTNTDIKAFKTFSKIEKLAHGNLICLTDEPQLLTPNATAISIWDI
ncbi:MAG: ATP-binding protein [Endomicrobia bacterium]|nr:ATP-binding protein [Endomicrobiia bacterium]